MELFEIKTLAVLAVVLLVVKRAVFGPQVLFARASVVMGVIGMGFLKLATQQGDFSSTIGAVFWLIGLLLAVAMISIDCFFMIRDNTGKK